MLKDTLVKGFSRNAQSANLVITQTKNKVIASYVLLVLTAPIKMESVSNAQITLTQMIHEPNAFPMMSLLTNSTINSKSSRLQGQIYFAAILKTLIFATQAKRLLAQLYSIRVMIKILVNQCSSLQAKNPCRLNDSASIKARKVKSQTPASSTCSSWSKTSRLIPLKSILRIHNQSKRILK